MLCSRIREFDRIRDEIGRLNARVDFEVDSVQLESAGFRTAGRFWKEICNVHRPIGSMLSRAE
jgi:hypothetical protein